MSSRWMPATPRRSAGATFQGFRRANGRFGTRNYLGILTIGELLGHGGAA